jgi:hypothetical protein
VLDPGAFIDLVFEDQYGRRGATADLRGTVLVLVHGDRGSADAARRFGAAVHQSIAQSVADILPPERRPLVIPVASFAEVPAIFRGTVRAAVRAAAADVAVWLDFTGRVQTLFQLAVGIPAAIILDDAGRFAGLRRGPFPASAAPEVAVLATRLAGAPAPEGRHP